MNFFSKKEITPESMASGRDGCDLRNLTKTLGDLLGKNQPLLVDSNCQGSG